MNEKSAILIIANDIKEYKKTNKNNRSIKIIGNRYILSEWAIMRIVCELSGIKRNERHEILNGETVRKYPKISIFLENKNNWHRYFKNEKVWSDGVTIPSLINYANRNLSSFNESFSIPEDVFAHEYSSVNELLKLIESTPKQEGNTFLFIESGVEDSSWTLCEHEYNDFVQDMGDFIRGKELYSSVLCGSNFKIRSLFVNYYRDCKSINADHIPLNHL